MSYKMNYFLAYGYKFIFQLFKIFNYLKNYFASLVIEILFTTFNDLLVIKESRKY